MLERLARAALMAIGCLLLAQAQDARAGLMPGKGASGAERAGAATDPKRRVALVIGNSAYA